MRRVPSTNYASRDLGGAVRAGFWRMKPRLLDLFCGAGGASMGYHRAGFEVVGVDIKDQPNYPFEFVRADALGILSNWWHVDGWDTFDAVHASPPCQAYSAMRVMQNARNDHADLIEPVRDALLLWGGPFVIENVEQAPLEVHPPTLFGGLSGIILCGSMFELWTDEYQLRRHRLFESNVTLAQPQCWHRRDKVVAGFYGDHARTRTRVRIDGKLHHARGTDITRNDDKLALVRDLMGIDWMTWSESNQAIPPAYTEFIGAQLLAHIGATV